jgi:hypothetical protein
VSPIFCGAKALASFHQVNRDGAQSNTPTNLNWRNQDWYTRFATQK